MKKTSQRIALTALASLAAAAAGSAHAQSVNLYGLIDVGVEHLSNVGTAGSITRMPGNTAALPSRVGMRGTEDLGDGLKAQFTLEMGFGPDTGVSNQGVACLAARPMWDWPDRGAR